MNIKDYTWVYISRGKHSKSAKIKNNKRHFLSRYSPYLVLGGGLPQMFLRTLHLNFG